MIAANGAYGDRVTPSEARAIAKTMFRELEKIPPRVDGRDNPEFFERAAVLADVVLQSNRPDVGEVLAIKLRRYFDSDRASEETWEIANAITSASEVMFPPRRGRCMPNREELQRLVANTHDGARQCRVVMRHLWSVLGAACDSESPMTPAEAMAIANQDLGGFGVVRTRYRGIRQRITETITSFAYVNTGETYDMTLCFLTRWNGKSVWRFEVSSWGDLVEATERRFRTGEWSVGL